MWWSPNAQMLQAKIVVDRASRIMLRAVISVCTAQDTVTLALEAATCEPPIALAPDDCCHDTRWDLLTQGVQSFERSVATMPW